ncbi:MAG: DnaJ domain-containing protein [Gammaproteobacteria bacterium]|nr:DnaJ domain-containing protein [Gammaproteobacteria bacterium]
MQNPLIPDILSLLHQHPEGISEYLIIQSLETQLAFDEIADDYQLAIFQKHFMVMNALYRLQKNLWLEEQLLLEIAPLKIQLIFNITRSDNSQLSEVVNGKLSEYYLDWSQLENTDKEAVEALLESFWKLYLNAENRTAAFEILELEENASDEKINRRYRQLARQHHPDKGGEPALFIRIRQAYETLIQ